MRMKIFLLFIIVHVADLVPVPELSRINRATRSISQQKCDDFKTIVTNYTDGEMRENCPHLKSIGMIVGGVKAKAGEFAAMAAIGWKTTKGEIGFKCGGTLISERFILTAAHCANVGIPDVVRLGDLDLSVNTDNKNVKDFGIEEFIPHPNFTQSVGDHDIALIKLKEVVEFDAKYIRPACLHSSQLYQRRVTATGWGKTRNLGETSDALMKVQIKVIDSNKCYKDFKNQLNLKKSSSDFICAGEEGKDTCEGDSGGPILIRRQDHRCMHDVVGVTSHGGKLCGKKIPALYTRVFSYIGWIEDEVWLKN